MARKKKEILATIKGGTTNPKARGQIRRELEYHEGKRVRITIERYYKKRSNPQNAYYHGCVIAEIRDCFLDKWGEIITHKAAHEFCLTNFFGEEHVIEETSEVIRLSGSSSGHTTVEFEEKMDEIRQWFELNMDWMIPLPNEQLSAPLDPEAYAEKPLP